MAKNTGKLSERIWEDSFARYGKRAFVHRFVDASEITGKTGKVAVSASPQPSDFLLVLDGVTSFCEVKSTQNPTSFAFSLLKPTQSAQGKMILSAGGQYLIFAHALALDQWFYFPLSLVQRTKDQGKSSLKWQDLISYKWEPLK